MKKFLLILALLLASSCSSNSLTSSSPYQSNFATGEPVDIPITIAKAIAPIDATKIRAEVSNGSPDAGAPLLTKQVALTCGAITIIGAEDATDGAKHILAINQNGQIIEEFNSASNGSFTHTFSETELTCDEPVALVVSLNIRVSYAVIVTVHNASNPPFTTHPYTVAISNVTGTVAVNPVIAPDNLCVAFTATDTSGNPFVVCVPSVAGGFFETYTSDISSTLSEIQFASDSSFLVGVDSTGRIIRVDGTTGQATVISDTSLEGRNIKLSPNDAFVVTETPNADNANRRHISFEPTAISASQQSDAIQLNEGFTTHLGEDLEWVDNDTLIAFIHYLNDELDSTSGRYDAQLFELGSNLTGGSQDITVFASTLLTAPPAARILRNPRMIPGSGSSLFTYEEEQLDGNFFLMQSNFAFAQTTLVGAAFGQTGLSSSRWTADGAFLIFQAEFGSGADAFSVIASYDANAATTQALTLGVNPSPSPTDANVVGYLSTDFSGELQVSVLNLDFY